MSDRTRSRLLAIPLAWIDSHSLPPNTPRVVEGGNERRVDWLRILPFIGMHLACLGVVWVGVSATALWVAAILYAVRMFAITGFYHRYFSHRSFRTSRAFQLVMAIAGASAVQRGPLWWAAHHRDHHLHSDGPADVHSPHQHGLLWSHMGWITSRANFPTKLDRVPDLARFPELRFLDRFDLLVPVALAVGLVVSGETLRLVAPDLGTSGAQLLVWGFFVSTIVLFHATCLINSAAHTFGRRRYETSDQSRNSFLLALLTFGEGWHNNHHHCQRAARQGFFWWEIDPTYYLLELLSRIGLIWDLKRVPPHLKMAHRSRDASTSGESTRASAAP